MLYRKPKDWHCMLLRSLILLCLAAQRISTGYRCDIRG